MGRARARSNRTRAHMRIAASISLPAGRVASRRLETGACVCLPTTSERAVSQTVERAARARAREPRGVQGRDGTARTCRYPQPPASARQPAASPRAAPKPVPVRTCRARASEPSVRRSSGRRGRGQGSHGACRGAPGRHGPVDTRSRRPQPVSRPRRLAPPRNQCPRGPATHGPLRGTCEQHATDTVSAVAGGARAGMGTPLSGALAAPASLGAHACERKAAFRVRKWARRGIGAPSQRDAEQEVALGLHEDGAEPAAAGRQSVRLPVENASRMRSIRACALP